MPNPENLEGQGFHTDPNRINKEGRPKGTKNLSTILKAMLEEDVEVVIDGKKERRQFQEVIIRKLLKKANDGEIRAITEIFDRIEGKANQLIDLDLTTGGKPFTLNVKPDTE
jgi:Rad3-related DNA helicase